MVAIAKREPEDELDQQLLDEGWEFSGIGLFKHPALAPKIDSRSYTKQQALDMKIGEQYRDVQKEWDMMYQFIQQFVNPHDYIDKYLLADEAKQLLDDLKRD